MDTARSQTIQGVLLIAILSLYGWSLIRTAQASYSQRSKSRQSLVNQNRELVFETTGGIDIFGDYVDLGAGDSPQHTVFFLLHAGSLNADVNFWHHVETALPYKASFRLVAYCDGDVCSSEVRKSSQATNFTVIEYGEAAGTQALVNADDRGDAILRIKNKLIPKQLGWRTPGITAQEFVQELLR